MDCLVAKKLLSVLDTLSKHDLISMNMPELEVWDSSADNRGNSLEWVKKIEI